VNAARVLISGTNRLATAIEEKLRAAGAAVGRLADDPAALTAAALDDATGLVMRAESAELSATISEHKDAIAVSSVAVTADEFVRHALRAARGSQLLDAVADA
jgi:hypothetical protein